MIILQNMHVVYSMFGWAIHKLQLCLNNILDELTEEAVIIELSSLFHSNMEETIGLHV